MSTELKHRACRTARWLRAGSLAAVGLLATGCGVIGWVGVELYYEEAPEPGRVIRDVAYWQAPEADPEKHRLDLFLPQGDGFATLLFVHGGGWTEGDKGLVVGGADVYGNIGRFYADRGYGVAVINYRLQPAVTWRQQVEDVARALAWVHQHIGDYGGDPRRLFLSGHSAGAQLSARAAVDSELLEGLGMPPAALCGVIPASGAGYDIADQKTYELGARRSYYEERFRAGDPTDAWRTEASAVSFVDADTPPFLLLHVENEWISLHHQNQLFKAVLEEAGVPAWLVVVPGESHARMVLALSRDDKTAGPAILDFLATVACPRPAGEGEG